VISILYEDDDVVAANKPEGLASVPGHDAKADSLLRQLSAARPNRLFIVHRLDKAASGVILLAKNRTAHRLLNTQFSERAVGKRYLALVYGLISEDSGIIDKPIRQFGSGRMGIDQRTGKPSMTKYAVTQRYQNSTLLAVEPVTGRRHQIRVHLYSVGHPIVGDERYGDLAQQRTFPRLMLHAQEISFRLPSGVRMSVQAPVPDSFQTGLDRASRFLA
jgi:RluA family pseudouridine synthase